MNMKDQVVKYKGTYYIVTSEGVGTYTVYPQGGGYKGLIPKSECVLVDKIPVGMRTGHAYIDVPELSTYPCVYNENYYWNGWRCPAFDEDIILKMLEHFKMETVSKDDAKGEWLVNGVSMHIDDSSMIRRGSDGRWAFDGWCWSILEDAIDGCDNEDIKEQQEMLKGIVEPYPQD